MAISLMDTFSDEEFSIIVQNSFSYKECLINLGYKSDSGNSTAKLKNKISKIGLSTEHFTSNRNPIKRTPENTFIENSTADQSSLRRLYKAGNYTPYICSICSLEPYWNGKELTLILDHINGHNKDDRLENLRWVCPNCNQQLDTTNARNPVRKKIEPNRCIDCGIPISKGSKRCCKCNAQFVIDNTNIPISRDELKNLIRLQPFTEIGSRFGVTDNCIRKWCDKYNLPRKKTDIKSISDTEWSKI